MTKVSDIRDSLELIIGGVLPAYKKLSDRIDTEDSALQLLEQGYAIGYGPAEGIYDELCMGQMHQRREFRVTLTKLYMADTDADFRIDLETTLMEDEFKVIGAITKNTTLTGVAINSVFAFDQGLQYLEADQKQFIIIVMSFGIDYMEGV